MSRLVVFATALSRLHADLLMARLRQAGISRSSLSAVYPLASKPNAGLCWLSGRTRLELSSGEPVEVSGRLRIALGHGPRGAGHTSLPERLADFGLSRQQSAELEESLLESHLVLAIEVHGEAALNAAFQVLHGLSAEKIMPVSTHARIASARPQLVRRRASTARGSLPAFGAFAEAARGRANPGRLSSHNGEPAGSLCPR